jgi:putative pyruvate formate lyase activating enzyme
LQKLFSDLAMQGCHNWNLVSPTPWLPQIKEVTLPLIRAGISLPFVYNSSGFELPETLDNFRELINIGLIDLRYATNQTALEGSDALNYVEVSRRAFKWFWNQLGPLELDADNVAKRGIICRLLALPNRVHEAITNLEWLARNIGNDVAVSVMAQYTPVHQAVQMPGWERAISKQEYEQLTEAVEDLGFENGWIQELKGDAPADLLGQDMPAGQGVVGKN